MGGQTPPMFQGDQSLDILHYQGDGPSWPLLETLTWNAEQYFHIICLWEMTEERQELYTLKIMINRRIQGMLVQTSHLALTMQSVIHI